MQIQFDRLLNHLGIFLESNRFAIDKRSLFQDKKISGKEIYFPVVERAGKRRLMKVTLKELVVAIKKCN